MVYRFSNQAESAIYNWANHVSSCTISGWNPTIIWDKPGKDRPELPYVTLNSGPMIRGGVDVKYLELDSYEYTYREEFILSLNVFDDNGHLDYMNVFLNSFNKDCCYKYLRDVGLSYWLHYGPFDLSKLSDSMFKFRSVADIKFSFGHTEIVPDVEIHKVKINDWDDVDAS